MDWRVAVTGFALGAGFALGWLEFGTLGGAVVAAVFALGCLGATVLIDKFVYNL